MSQRSYNHGDYRAAKSNNHTGLKIIAVVLALLAIAYVVISLVLGGVWNPVKWNFNKSLDNGTKPDAPADENGGIIFNPGEEQTGLMLMSYTIAPEDYAAYGISEQAESAYVINSVIRDENSEALDAYQFVTYSVEWAGETDEVLSECISYTTTDSSLTFEILKPFATQIIVTGTSTLEDSLTATTTVDYYQRLTAPEIITVDWTLVGVGGSMATMSSNTVQLYKEPTSGVGSIANPVKSYKVTVTAVGALGGSINNYAEAIHSSTRKTSYSFNNTASINQLDFFAKFLTDGDPSAIYPTLYMYRYHMQTAAQGGAATVAVEITPTYGDVVTYSYNLTLSIIPATLTSITQTPSQIIA